MQDENRLGDQPEHECQHVGCHCTVAPGEWYCCDYCSEEATKEGADSDQTVDEDFACQCGHAHCHAAAPQG